MEPWDEWSEAEYSIYEGLGDFATDDTHLAFLYHEALFDMDISPDFRASAYDALVEYMWDEYEIDFDDVMDWEAYREWYG